MIEQHRGVKPVHVVGEEVDHLADGGLTQGGVGELESLPVEQGAAGHPNLHAGVHDPEEVGVVGEGVESSHGDHAGPVQVGLGQGDSAVGCEVLDHPTLTLTI